MKYDSLQTIRYMGNKSKLLDFIIPEILKITPQNGIVCDLLSGSNAISYALKRYRRIITNDIQEYSFAISIALIVNQFCTISKISALHDLESNYELNLKQKHFHFFEDVYSNTYFSKKQCQDIDAIRFAISKITDLYTYNLYLTALMGAMCKVQSTPGHFAQYMPNSNKRIKLLQAMSLIDEFYNKCDEYNNLVFNKYENKAYCADFHKLLNDNELNDISTIYLDSPYSQEQYSRFYHVLETIVKYDNPKTNYKAKYRDKRFMSNFCYKNKVEYEFETIFKYCKLNTINLIISYSNKGVIDIKKLYSLAKLFFPNVTYKSTSYKHSTQGKGSNGIIEYLIICTF